MEKKKESSFSEEKEAKRLYSLRRPRLFRPWPRFVGRRGDKSLLVLFFRKELLLLSIP
jgi:hypothetical protein